MNCCAFANDEVLDFEINQCDSDQTKTIDKDKDITEQVITPVLNSQVIDRMLLRTSTIQLPSLVTGASGNMLIFAHYGNMLESIFNPSPKIKHLPQNLYFSRPFCY